MSDQVKRKCERVAHGLPPAPAGEAGRPVLVAGAAARLFAAGGSPGPSLHQGSAPAPGTSMGVPGGVGTVELSGDVVGLQRELRGRGHRRNPAASLGQCGFARRGEAVPGGSTSRSGWRGLFFLRRLYCALNNHTQKQTPRRSREQGSNS